VARGSQSREIAESELPSLDLDILAPFGVARPRSGNADPPNL